MVMEAHWLERYATGYHRWHTLDDSYQRKMYYRPLGLVEWSFDTDGTDYEGRADMNVLLTLDIRSSLTKEEYRKRVLLAWACLQVKHPLLHSRCLSGSQFLATQSSKDKAAERFFAVMQPENVERALIEASESLVFLEDTFPKVDPNDFYRNCMNSSRIVDPNENLVKVLIHPVEQMENASHRFRLSMIAAHQIGDGLSVQLWISNFVDYLNKEEGELEDLFAQLCEADGFWSRLPSAQEDLYPKISGNVARQRWFWAISRILRHTRVPPPDAFTNPLTWTDDSRESRSVISESGLGPAVPKRMTQVEGIPPTYNSVLSYERKPPIVTLNLHCVLSPKATRTLKKLCGEANTSIGAGCFALVGIVMMDTEEEKHPGTRQRRPFVGSFPLNPRPFYGYKGPVDSLMLGFSDGLTIPFTSSKLPIEGRIRLAARQAHRQLRTLRKAQPKSTSPIVSQLIPWNYLSMLQRADGKSKYSKKINPQGQYPVRTSAGATCGVSSIGTRLNLLSADRFPVDKRSRFRANFTDLQNGVRARDGEFLVGCFSDMDSLHLNISYDASRLDENAAKMWKSKVESLLELVELNAKL